jgi:hypothetical protein
VRAGLKIKRKKPMKEHPKITIGCVELNPAQASTMWAALQEFRLSHENPLANGNDSHGKKMTSLYLRRAREVQDIWIEQGEMPSSIMCSCGAYHEELVAHLKTALPGNKYDRPA